MKTKILLFLTFVCVFSMSFSLPFYSGSVLNEPWADKSEKASNKITAIIANQLKKEKKLYLVVIGGGIVDTAHKFNLGFYFHQKVSLKEARELIIYAINASLIEINSNPEWAPYFSEYPVTVKTLDIHIYIEDPDSLKIPFNEIVYISTYDGKLEFDVSIPPNGRMKTIHEETYEQGLAIISAKEKDPVTIENRKP